MNTGLRKLRRGFTLVELTIAMMIGLMVSAMVLAIFNQQMAFLCMPRWQMPCPVQIHV